MHTETNTIEHENAPKPHAAETFVHDSNPFTTTRTGIKKLFTYNSGALIGVIIFNVVAGIVLVATVLAMVVALLVFMLNHVFVNFDIVATVPSQLDDLAAGVNDMSVYATLGIGLVIAIGIGSLMQIVAIRVATTSIQKQTQSFGQVLKYSMKRIVPTVGLAALLIGVFVVTAIVIALLIRPLSFITIPLALIVIILCLYASIRLLFVWLSVVDGKGPIAAIKESWCLTQNRFFETIGIASASALVVTIPFMIIGVISANIGGAFDAIVSFVLVLVACGAGVIIMAGIAERFWQFRYLQNGQAQATKVSPLNYLAVVIYVVASILSSALTPQNPTTTGGFENYFQQELRKDQHSLPDGTTNPDNFFDNYNQPGSSDSDSSPSYNYN